jgi:AcrR family transcriptional regulator
MPGPASAARERILETASRLFYERGIRAVGVDTIVAESNVAKTTLYQHFKSKDDLIAAYLQASDENLRAWFATLLDAGDDPPEERLLAVFRQMGDWVARAGFRGCGFINASMELADRTHPGSAVAAGHKDHVRDAFAALAREAGVTDPDRLARELLVLLDGAFVGAAMQGTTAPFETAERAAAPPPRARGV